jgi:hypothetical protein
MLRVDIENAWGFLHSENESVSFLLAKTCRNLKTSAMLLSIVSLWRLNPLTPSLKLLIRFRNNKPFVDPHRM